MDAQHLIGLLDLKPLPEEGGYFRETYAAEEFLAAQALPPRYAGPRRMGSAIYYLLAPDTFSALHRLKTDEVYHFYLGDPVELFLLRPEGSGEVLRLGTNLDAGERPQAVAPRGVWQGSRLRPGGRFALLGTTMAPGFDFADFELGRRAELGAQFPQHRDWIERLTRS